MLTDFSDMTREEILANQIKRNYGDETEQYQTRKEFCELADVGNLWWEVIIPKRQKEADLALQEEQHLFKTPEMIVLKQEIEELTEKENLILHSAAEILNVNIDLSETERKMQETYPFQVIEDESGGLTLLVWQPTMKYDSTLTYESIAFEGEQAEFINIPIGAEDYLIYARNGFENEPDELINHLLDLMNGVNPCEWNDCEQDIVKTFNELETNNSFPLNVVCNNNGLSDTMSDFTQKELSSLAYIWEEQEKNINNSISI